MSTGADRQAAGQLYPWYDSKWLARYTRGKTVLARVRPAALPAFVDACRVFHTRPDFRPVELDRVFDDGQLQEVRRAIAALRPAELKLHEARSFGRFVVHDHPLFTELQRGVVQLVSEAVGEAVEPSYNFLSLYSRQGVCPVHMDSPEAKWTLDVCVDQSAPWPIHFSDVQPWPEAGWSGTVADHWEDDLKRTHRFTAHTLTPGRAVVFSGSSQWHYRDAMPAAPGRPFCDLLFFHFVPAGTLELVNPDNWARLFDVPELDGAVHNASADSP